jgi:hypothetical protein
MVVDHPLRERLDVKIRGLGEGHAAELYLRHVLDCDVTHKGAVTLHVRTGPARADGAWACPGLFRRGRLRTFRLRAAAEDEGDGSYRDPQQSSAFHRILATPQAGVVPN